MRYFFLAAILFLSTYAAAQGYKGGKANKKLDSLSSIRGRIIDSSTGKPVEFANITLFNSKDSTVATGAVSNFNGYFDIGKINPGKYYAKATFIGYKTYVIKDLNISRATEVLNLGTVKITPSSIRMGAVVVKANNDMIVTNLDKQVINVEKDLSSAGGSALDVMQNIPSVTIDIDGNVSLRGNSNVTILIDGKPSGLSGLSSSDVLTSIPASSIASVELITNPSAKYDPDGTAGIINIVLKKRANLGFNGIFDLNAGTGNKYTGGANFNYRTGDINFFGDLAGRFYQFNRNGFSDRTNFLNSSTSYLKQNSAAGYNLNMTNVNLGSEYLFDNYNTVSLSVQYRHFQMKNSGVIDNSTLGGESNLLDYFVNNNNGNRDVNFMHYSLDYKRDFAEKGMSLTASFMFNNIGMTSATGTDYNYLTVDGTTSVLPLSLTNNTYNNFHRMFIGQVDYVQPVGRKDKIEAGLKSTVADLGMDYNFYNWDPGQTLWINNYLRSNNFDYKEQVHAVYGIFIGGLGNFKYQAGLRGEYAATNSRLITNNVSFGSHYFTLYPSVYLAYDFSPLHELKISYSKRVDRPRPWQLNPFTNYSDSLNLSYGNPDLQPQFTNSYELGYSTILFDFNVYSSLFYKQTNGMITRISNLVDNGVTQSTFENIASQKNYGTELVANGRLFKWWSINANVSYFRSDINDPVLVTAADNYSYSYTGRINSTWKIDKSLSLQVSSTYDSPIVSAQGKTDAIYFTDVALKKDFMNGNLSLFLRLSDIFNTRKYSSETYGTNFTLFNEGQRDSRILFLGISYNFNNYKQKQNDVKDLNINDEMGNE